MGMRSTSRRGGFVLRLVIAVVVLSGTVGVQLESPRPALAAGPPTAQFDWEMPERFGLDTRTINYDRATGRTWLTPGPDGLVDYDYSPSFLAPSVWRVNLDACSSSPGGSPIVSYTWLIQGATSTTGDCRFAYDFPALGTYPVALTVTAQDGQRAATSVSVVVEDILGRSATAWSTSAPWW